MNTLAFLIEIVAVLLTLSGVAYGVLALWGARAFGREGREVVAQDWFAKDFEGLAGVEPPFAPGVSILKPVKGVDPRMYAGFVSHCVQEYAGEMELLFGVGSVEDPAVAEVARLRVEFPQVSIRLIECPLRLGTSGKVSNLVQMLPEARFEHVIVNDSDIRVSPRYLARVMAGFEGRRETQVPFGNDNQKGNSNSNSNSNDNSNGNGNSNGNSNSNSNSGDERVLSFEDRVLSGGGGGAGAVGMVTVPYIGRAERTVWSRLEALGISTDFMAGVLTARKLEGGIRFGLGSTLAMTKTALRAAGGLEPLVESLADDYELGARIAKAGYRVELVQEVVETTVPAYTLRGFCEHQLRWARSTRDSRRWGYVGLGVTYVLPWAVLAVVASGGALWSFSLLSVAGLVRVAVALTVGVGVLRDGQVLRDFALLPLRDCFALFFWAWSYAGDTVVWRGERFTLRRGKLERQTVDSRE